MGPDRTLNDPAAFAPPAENALGHLPARVRDIAALRGFGYSCVEIGRRLGITHQAVSLTLSRHYRRISDMGDCPELFELSTRAANALARLGINGRADARGRDLMGLLRQERNCGAKTIAEIRTWLDGGVSVRANVNGS